MSEKEDIKQFAKDCLLLAKTLDEAKVKIKEFIKKYGERLDSATVRELKSVSSMLTYTAMDLAMEGPYLLDKAKDKGKEQATK